MVALFFSYCLWNYYYFTNKTTTVVDYGRQIFCLGMFVSESGGQSMSMNLAFDFSKNMLSIYRSYGSCVVVIKELLKGKLWSG